MKTFFSMVMLQGVVLAIAWWIFATDPGWNQVGKMDWRGPCFFTCALFGGLLIPGFSLWFALRSRASVLLGAFWALNLVLFSAVMIWSLRCD